MKKILFILFILLSVESIGQQTKKYFERLGATGTIDSGYVKLFTDSVFSYTDDSFISLTVEYFSGQYNPILPNGFSNFKKSADGVYRNFTQRVTFSGVASKPTTLSGYGITDGVANTLTVNGKALNANISITASDVSLGNVDNTSDANKPVSTAQQTALNLKANLASPTFTGTVSGVTATMVGLGNVTNESKATMFTSPTFTGNVVLGTPASGNFSTGTFTWPTFNQSTTGSAATLTTTRTIWGQNFNGSANVTGDLALGVNSITMSGSIGITGTRVTKIWATDGEFTNMPTVGGSSLSSTFQPLNAKLTSIGALANGSGYLKNNGSGTFTYETPAGAGTVTNTGNLTSNAVVLGNGTTDTKVIAGITTDGTAQLVLGVNATSLGSVKMFGNTSGDATIQPSAVAGTGTIFTLPPASGTALLNTTTSGIAATATASGTQTITHNLGRTPTIIRIYSISNFTSSTSATPVPFSMGVFNSSGNRCVYMVINGTTAQVSQTSTVFSIIMVTSAGNQITGVIQNVTSTGFDIVWSETGTHTAGNFMWEAQ